MSYKNKNNKGCEGGIEHPTRDGVLCWGNHDPNTEGHWAYIATRDGMRRVSWRVEV